MVLASMLDSKAVASKPASKLIKKTTKSRKALHIAPPRMTSRRKAQNVITKFHRLTHELDRLEQQKLDEVETRKLRIAEINRELIEMGGRQAYQDASILSTSFYRTSKWVFRLLTLGAINTQLLSCPWLIVRAIDLKYRHKRIEQCDFFSLKPAGEFVSSVVLNCTPGAVKRGQMLRMYREHLMDGGLLFLMCACVIRNL
ncbi:putative S-adenosylmethionine-dependent methyltransferase Bmt2 [Plasmopara halstedii]